MIDLTPVVRQAGGPGLKGEAYTAATRQLQEWHQGESNDCGVFVEGESVLLAAVGRSRAAIKLVQTGRGHWLTGHSFDCATGGRGSPVSVWSCFAFETRNEAIHHEAGIAMQWFEREITSPNSCVSDAMRIEARKMVEAIKTFLNPPAPQPQQLSMF